MIERGSLDHIRSASISYSINKSGKTLFTLPFGCFLETQIYGDRAWIWNINVPEQLRGNDIAVRLLQGFAVKCLQQGITSMEGNVINPDAIKAGVKAFGSNAIILKNDNNHPYSIEQGIEALKARIDISRLRIKANLEHVNASQWEVPVLQEKTS